MRYAFELCGADGWIVTKLDVLSGFDTLLVGTEYAIGDAIVDRYPADHPSVEEVEVRYREVPGWAEDISGVRR